MTAPSLSMATRNPAAGTVVVDIVGEVTAACEPLLAATYEQLNSDRPRRVLLNFTGLQYMNSGGIGMLVTLLVRTNRQRQRLGAFGLSPHYRQIFELTRLDEAISIFDDEAAALADGNGRWS